LTIINNLRYNKYRKILGGKKMENVKSLYIVNVFSVKEKNLEDYEQEAKIKSIIHNRTITASQIRDKYAISKSDHYKFCIDEVLYSDTLEYANEFLEKNICDVYEYCYDYAVIIKVPLNAAYPSTYVDELYLYKFNNKKFGYEKITKEEIDENLYKAIASKFNFIE
jgi:hypothetical protein